MFVRDRMHRDAQGRVSVTFQDNLIEYYFRQELRQQFNEREAARNHCSEGCQSWLYGIFTFHTMTLDNDRDNHALYQQEYCICRKCCQRREDNPTDYQLALNKMDAALQLLPLSHDEKKRAAQTIFLPLIKQLVDSYSSPRTAFNVALLLEKAITKCNQTPLEFPTILETLKNDISSKLDARANTIGINRRTNVERDYILDMLAPVVLGLASAFLSYCVSMLYVLFTSPLGAAVASISLPGLAIALGVGLVVGAATYGVRKFGLFTTNPVEFDREPPKAEIMGGVDKIAPMMRRAPRAGTAAA